MRDVDPAASAPDLTGTVPLRGLEAPVDVVRDAIGCPHVRAASTHDAFFAQGFVHAQDRLWQMEYDRRRAAGRLAECCGPQAVTMDTFARRLGLAAAARADHERFDADTRAVLEAYAAGVNAFIDLGVHPFEFQLLGLTPEPWEPWHCSAVFKARHVLMNTMDTKLWRARLLEALGRDATVLAASADGSRATLIVPVGGEARVEVDADEVLPAALAVGAPSAEASNSWAVHGSRTASGLPLLAGDSHRTLEVPNVYYQNHIACSEFDVIGLSMPGVPGMSHFGHNAHVAWCVTHAMADTQDLWVEHFDAEGNYEFRGEWHAAERRTEVIQVRDAAPVEVDITTTHHGPVVVGEVASGTAITMRWTGADIPNMTIPAALSALRATSVEDFDDRMRGWVDPCQSVLAADVHGQIAYLYRGRMPVRSRANGWAPVPGWTGTHEWQGDVPYEELPRLRNPDTGYIATANNRVCGNDYPHYLGMDYANPSRVRRVLERVAALEQATVTDMADIHADRLALPARRFVEAVGRLESLSGRTAEAQRLLAAWDGRMDADAAAPTLYAALRMMLAEVIAERDPLSGVGDPFPEEPDPTPKLTRIRRAEPRLLTEEGASFLGTTAEELVAEAFTRAVAWLTEQLGPGPDTWLYHRIHVTRIVHPLSAVFEDAAELLDPAPVPLGGDAETVLCSTAELDCGIEHSSVTRYVFDCADWDRSAWIVPLGVSGHPASPHYADQSADWSAVRLRPMTYTWERVEAGAEARQRLEPR